MIYGAKIHLIRNMVFAIHTSRDYLYQSRRTPNPIGRASLQRGSGRAVVFSAVSYLNGDIRSVGSCSLLEVVLTRIEYKWCEVKGSDLSPLLQSKKQFG